MKPILTTVILLGVLLSSVAKSAEFKSQFVSIKAQGSGPDLILLHGFASSPKVWSEVAKKLQSHFRLHLVHVAGLADLPAPETAPESYLEEISDEVTRYVEVEHLEKPTLIGHSMGGLLSLMISSSNEVAVERVIVVDALPFFSLLFNPQATTDQALPQAKALEELIVNSNDMQFERQATASISILTKSDAKRELLLKWSKESNRKAYAQILREAMVYDARPELHAIECPVAVMHAYDSATGVPKEHSSQLYKNAYAEVKDARIEQVVDSYHFIMWDQPEKFIELLNEMLLR